MKCGAKASSNGFATSSNSSRRHLIRGGHEKTRRRQLVQFVNRLVRSAAGAALAAASIAMLVQVFARFVLSAPLPWPEEFAVLLFAWITFLGAAAVQYDDSHLSIDSLRGRLSASG